LCNDILVESDRGPCKQLRAVPLATRVLAQRLSVFPTLRWPAMILLMGEWC